VAQDSHLGMSSFEKREALGIVVLFALLMSLTCSVITCGTPNNTVTKCRECSVAADCYYGEKCGCPIVSVGGRNQRHCGVCEPSLSSAESYTCEL